MILFRRWLLLCEQANSDFEVEARSHGGLPTRQTVRQVRARFVERTAEWKRRPGLFYFHDADRAFHFVYVQNAVGHVGRDLPPDERTSYV